MGPCPWRFGRNIESIDFEFALVMSEGSKVKEGGYAVSVASVATACL